MEQSIKTSLLVSLSVGLGLSLAYIYGQSSNNSSHNSVSSSSNKSRRSHRRGRKHYSPSSEPSSEGDSEDTMALQSHSRSHSPIPSELRRWQGFSVSEAKVHSDARNELVNSLTPDTVLQELQRGNARFWNGASQRPKTNALLRRSLLNGQYPTVAVLGCSDSRVPVEIVFDQGLGDIFVIRVAGNILEDTTQASLEYAVAHLKVKVLVILGHEGCGAVKAAQSPLEQFAHEPPALKSMLTTIKSGLDQPRLEQIHDCRARDREAVATNVRHQITMLNKDDLIKSKVASGDLLVTGAFYEISSGIVDFFAK